MDSQEKPKRPPTPLETLGDVERALARLAHRVDRCKMNLDQATALKGIYQALAAIMQDQRDSHFKSRVSKLWEHYEKTQKGTQPASEQH